MKAFDTDVLTEILAGQAAYVARAEQIPADDQKIRVSTHDLRIAAICVSASATLISRNRADFQRIPGLDVEFWELEA
jgi:tRNA(fMet)-specific endonuclease VapC